MKKTSRKLVEDTIEVLQTKRLIGRVYGNFSTLKKNIIDLEEDRQKVGGNGL